MNRLLFIKSRVNVFLAIILIDRLIEVNNLLNILSEYLRIKILAHFAEVIERFFYLTNGFFFGLNIVLGVVLCYYILTLLESHILIKLCFHKYQNLLSHPICCRTLQTSYFI